MTKCLQPVHNKTTFAATVRSAVPLGITAQPTWRNPLRKERQSKSVPCSLLIIKIIYMEVCQMRSCLYLHGVPDTAKDGKCGAI